MQRVLRLPAQAVVFQFESCLKFIQGIECLVSEPAANGHISVRFSVPMLSIDDSEYEHEQEQEMLQQEQQENTRHSQQGSHSRKPPVLVAAVTDGKRNSHERALLTITYSVDYSDRQANPRFDADFPRAMRLSKQAFRMPQWSSSSDIFETL